VLSVSCKVALVEKVQSHKTKKWAKQLAARDVLIELKSCEKLQILEDLKNTVLVRFE
jgi:hypothetical protein